MRFKQAKFLEIWWWHVPKCITILPWNDALNSILFCRTDLIWSNLMMSQNIHHMWIQEKWLTDLILFCRTRIRVDKGCMNTRFHNECRDHKIWRITQITNWRIKQITRIKHVPRRSPKRFVPATNCYYPWPFTWWTCCHKRLASQSHSRSALEFSLRGSAWPPLEELTSISEEQKGSLIRWWNAAWQHHSNCIFQGRDLLGFKLVTTRT